jgi:Flp pilus assembly protein TadD
LAYLPRALAIFSVTFDASLTDREAALLVDWLKAATIFDFREGEFLLYRLRQPGSPRRLGRVPLLEETAVNALRSGEKEPGARAATQLDLFAPESSSAELIIGLRTLIRRPKETASAEDYFRRATKDNEASALAWRGLGFSLLQRKEMTSALASLERAVALNPSDPEIRADLAMALLRSGVVDKAVEHLEAAISLAPERDDIRRALASAQSVRR